MATRLPKISDWYAGNLHYLPFDVTDKDHGSMPLDLTSLAAKWSLAVMEGSAYSTEPTLEKKSSTGGIVMLPTKISAAAVSAGGTGYVVGDKLLVLGGEGDPGYVTVATIGALGAVATVTVSGVGTYSSSPSTPAATSGGSGSGCTLTLTMATYVGRLLVTVLSADTVDMVGDFHEELEIFDAGPEAEVVAVRDVKILPNVVNT